MDAKAPQVAAARLLSLDAFRGFVMLAMASDGLGLAAVARNFPKNRFANFVAYEFDHVPWVGCAIWDLIQPSFMFMVGVAMAFSCANRQSRGQSYGRMFAHAVFRAIVLILLGFFLRTAYKNPPAHVTYFTFEDVITQIGLGYVFLFLLWGRGIRVQLAAVAVILVGYWLYFALYPLPPADFDWAAVKVPSDWPHLSGFAAHWDKNSNAAAAFDQWFLNLFPRDEKFIANNGGYLTLSFIPSLATMILGLVTGEVLRGPRSGANKLALMVGCGVLGLAAGLALDALGICPLVKRIWTPSWTLFSAGWAVLGLSTFYLLVEVWNFRRWTFPFVVVGANSIAMYTMAELLGNWTAGACRIHFGPHCFQWLGPNFEPLVQKSVVLALMWLVCYWMYRRKVFIRI